MTFSDFNARTDGEAYSYRRNPLHEHSFLIIKKHEARKRYEPIGDYTVLDSSEDPVLSEKTVMNLVALLNGRKSDVMNLAENTENRMFYHLAPKRPDSDKTHIIFYTHDGEPGVSRENAVLSIEEELVQ